MKRHKHSSWNYTRLDYKEASIDQIKKLSEHVAAMDYDGFTAHASKPSLGVFSPVDRYLLPCDSVWLSVDTLFEPLPIPKLPAVPSSHPNFLAKYGDYLEPRLNALREFIDAKERTFKETFNTESSRLLELRDKYSSEEPEAIATLIEIAHKRHPMPHVYHDLTRNGFRSFIDPNAKVALIELQFPDFAGHKFQTGITARFKPKYASAAENKRIVRRCLYSVVIRAGYLASKVLERTSYETIAINVVQNWFDPATGSPRSGIICSLQAQVCEFAQLLLSQVDPEACFRHLKGIAVPSFDSISPIRPVFVLNKSDDRFVAARELDSLLAPEANLAAMPWEDFEHLVAQVFEWEFAKEGVEVRVTRASRDRGVDAVLFDPDPLRGGKFVLQAKRYTKPVDVAAVRDLYGTVLNEGANRGILITTSSYGPDAYEFAKNKPLSLVDGPNLLELLRRHGKKYRLDLEEARRLYQEIDGDL